MRRSDPYPHQPPHFVLPMNGTPCPANTAFTWLFAGTGILVAFAVFLSITRDPTEVQLTEEDESEERLLTPKDLDGLSDAASQKRYEEVAGKVSGNPTQIQRLVDLYVFGDAQMTDTWIEGRILEQMGEETHPRVLEILRDPKLSAKLADVEASENRSLSDNPKAPIHRLTELLVLGTPPPEAVPLLKPFLDEEPSIASSAAYAIGAVGSPEAVALASGLIENPAVDQDVRAAAVNGLQKAMELERVSEQEAQQALSVLR